MTERQPWQLLQCLKSGHRLFADQTGRVAIMDASGRTPSSADDGPLWLDRSRDLRLTTVALLVPVLTEDDAAAWVHVDAKDAEWFAKNDWHAELSEGVRAIIRAWRALGRTEHRR